MAPARSGCIERVDEGLRDHVALITNTPLENVCVCVRRDVTRGRNSAARSQAPARMIGRTLRRVVAPRYDEKMSEADRRERAKARRARGMVVERIASLDAPAAFHAGETVSERLTAMTRLCRAAWLVTGQPLPPSGRAQRASLPGEVYIPDHVAP